MNDEVNGYIYFNARVLLTEVNFDKSKVKHGGMYIGFDNLLTHFDLDMDAHNLPELYAQTQLNVERYADVIAVETPEELNAEDKRELLIRVCKTINDELSRFEVHTGSSAFLEDVCTY